MIIFVFITLILLWLFQVVFLEDFYSSIKRKSLDDVVNSIETSISETDTKGLNSLEVKNKILRTASDNNVIAVVADYEKKIYYDNSDLRQRNFIEEFLKTAEFEYLYLSAKDSVGEPQYLSMKNSELLQITTARGSNLISNITSFPIENNLNNGESLIFLNMIVNQNEDIITLMVMMELTPVNTTVETLRVQLFYVTGLMMVLASILAIVISHKIAKPIEKITQVAKTLGKERYISNLASPIKEVGELNDTLYFVDRELEKIEGIRRELMANISHDLRTPLTMIQGYSEVMRDIPGENNKDNIQVVIDESQRLQSLVNDILELSRLEEQKYRMRVKKYCLTDSLKDIVARYQSMLESKGYSLRFTYEKDVYVEADELKMSQVIYNLLNNAVTYTGEDKIIEIKQKVVGKYVRVEIVDTGEGIAEDKILEIWERYYKIDSKHRRAQIGSGIGLSIVKSIIEQHKGFVGVSSSNKGSTFWFEIKCVECSEEK
jgi:signal transduction histidine kinase